MAVSFDLNEDQRELQSGCTTSPRTSMRPAAHEWDEREEIPWPVHRRRRPRSGSTRSTSSPRQWFDETGLGIPITMEELFWGDAGIGLAIVGTTLAAAGVTANGTAEQVGEWVPEMFGTADEPKVAAFCASEPDAGSDVGAMRTRAVYDEETDEWVLNGTKTWATNGGIADVHVVDGGRRPRAPRPRARQLRRPPGHPGAQRRGRSSSSTASAPRTRPRWCSTTAASRATVCSAARTSSTSAWPGRARAARAAPASRRWRRSSAPGPRVGAQAVGIARAAYEYALDYAKEREQFGRPIIENQAHRVHARRHEDRDRRRPAAGLAGRLDGPHRRSSSQPAEGSMSKLVAGETAVRVTEQAIQILGGNGYTRDYPVERMAPRRQDLHDLRGHVARSSGWSSPARSPGVQLR